MLFVVIVVVVCGAVSCNHRDDAAGYGPGSAPPTASSQVAEEPVVAAPVLESSLDRAE